VTQMMTSAENLTTLESFTEGIRDRVRRWLFAEPMEASIIRGEPLRYIRGAQPGLARPHQPLSELPQAQPQQRARSRCPVKCFLSNWSNKVSLN
jgi:hypothetical protein